MGFAGKAALRPGVDAGIGWKKASRGCPNGAVGFSAWRGLAEVRKGLHPDGPPTPAKATGLGATRASRPQPRSGRRAGSEPDTKLSLRVWQPVKT